MVRPHALHLMRGQIFGIDGLTWFTMGGAASHDIEDGILDPSAPDFERRYWMLRRMNARFRVYIVPNRGKAQRNRSRQHLKTAMRRPFCQEGRRFT